VQRILEVHEGTRAVRCAGTGPAALSDADVDRIAARTADLLAERLRT
jgi:hypothetical protein